MSSRLNEEPYMPRYYLHLRDGTDEVLDPEGLEMPPDAVPGIALAAARDCMAEDKIAAAERSAVAEVRARAAAAAAAAAAALIAEAHDADADRAMVDQTIAGLGRTH
ncbi:MAG TPA: hypothetical protein VGD10_12645 [Allosphingosinicella sp.]|uniref:DUF6894 family protein n=1 Tax=Allosphingosinicella sp. TaxID=2823234 RepID=UPI002ED8BA87